MISALVVGDAHGNWKFMATVLEIARDNQVDVVIQVGDFGFWPDGWFASACNLAAANFGLPLVVLDGNHDDPADYAKWSAWPTDIDGLLSCHGLNHVPRGTVLDVHGSRVGFFGSGCSINQRSADYAAKHAGDRNVYAVEGASPGPGVIPWWPEETATDADVQRVVDAGPVDVWITHDTPENPPGRVSWSGPQWVLDRMEAQRVQMRRAFHAAQPKLHIHGHWHHRYVAPTPYGQVIGLGAESSDALILVELGAAR